jgi:hypothetical protein
MKLMVFYQFEDAKGQNGSGMINITTPNTPGTLLSAAEVDAIAEHIIETKDLKQIVLTGWQELRS